MVVIVKGIVALEALLPEADDDERAALVEALEHLNYLAGRPQVDYFERKREHA